MIALRVCVDVDDLEKGIRFFSEGLGLQLGRRYGLHWAEMLGASAPIDLLTTRAGSAPVPGMKAASENSQSAPVRSFTRHWTPVHLDFVVEDLDRAVRRAVDADAILERGPPKEPYGLIANLADPFGHGICLLQMNERGYDALVGMQ